MEMEAPAAVAFEKSDYTRDDNRVVLPPESVSLFADGVSLILSRWVKLQEVVAGSLDCWDGVAEHLRLTCGKVKHAGVDKMVAEILAFFLQPEEHCLGCIQKKELKSKDRCNVGHVHYLLHELMRITFNATIVRNPSMMEAADKLFNLHQDLLQGKYDSVEKLKKTLTWIGEDHMEMLRKRDELELKLAHREKQHRKISRRQRMKFRAYFA